MVRQTLKNTYHTSSLYLLKFLDFLSQGARKRSELQALFEADPDCLSALSTDTLRLYANALEELGCHLQRPDKYNGYHYKLIDTAFMIQFTPEEWPLLLDSLHTKLRGSSVPVFIRVYEMVEHFIKQKFLTQADKQQLRSLLDQYVLTFQLKNIKLLERSKSLNDFFLVEYEGKTDTHEWHLLHDSLVLDQGRFYWLCYRYNATSGEVCPLMLRVDRCRSVFPFNQSSLSESEKTKQTILKFIAEEPDLICQIVLPKGLNFSPPRLRGESYQTLTEEVSTSIPFWEEIQAFFEIEIYAVQYQVKTTHLFYLIQHLRSMAGFIIPVNQSCLNALKRMNAGRVS
jgi:hypothetical protein